MLQKLRRHHPKGFTLIELMIVIAIIGVLAAIALPNFLKYRQRSYNSESNSDAKNAFTAAQAYFVDHPNAVIDLPVIKAYGFVQSSYVSVNVGGPMSSMTISTFHDKGDKSFDVDQFGKITPQDR